MITKRSNAHAALHWTKRHRRAARLAYRVAGFIQGAFMFAIIAIVVFAAAILAGVP